MEEDSQILELDFGNTLEKLKRLLRYVWRNSVRSDKCY